jgi:phage terminase large subunit GpA-like protein
VNLADGYDLVVRTAIEAARPDPELRVDEWAEEFMKLPKSGPKPGDFRFDHSYPARRVHQVLSPSHPCKRVVARVASQMFKTQTALNWIGAIIHRRPRNILALEPTDTLVKRFSARVSTMIRNVPELRERVSAAKSRDSRNTVQAKDFAGDATLYMNTAGSAANLAEVSAPYIYFDEIDRAELSVDGEGDPVEIAEARATQYENDAKFFYTSSPSIKGVSKIDELHSMGTQEVYHVPCPHCGHLHELTLDNFHYQRDPDTGYMDRAWFTCPEKGCVIEEHHKTSMFPDVDAGGLARWVATAPGDGETVSFSLSAFYMPVGAITWLSLARQYARAKDRLQRGDHEAMKVFYNTRLGLSYDNSEATSTADQLRARAEPYPMRVIPDRALVVTMAVDTQGDRLEYQIEAWGPGMEHWVLDYDKVHGSPSIAPGSMGSPFNRIDEIRRTPLLHASGRPLMLSAYGIDAGGANTQDVYNYGAARRGLHCVVLHGATRPNRPIIGTMPKKVDIEWAGTKAPGGVELWEVGTDVAKDYLLLDRMKLTDGPGAMHFPQGIDDQWFDQLVAERMVTVYRGGRAVRKWINAPGVRNEATDLSVYNLAMAYKLGLHKWSALDWASLRAKLIPPTGDLFAPQADPPALPPAEHIDPETGEIFPAPAPAYPSAPDHLPEAGQMVAAKPVDTHPPAQQAAKTPPTPQPIPMATLLQAPSSRRRIINRGIQ